MEGDTSCKDVRMNPQAGNVIIFLETANKLADFMLSEACCEVVPELAFSISIDLPELVISYLEYSDVQTKQIYLSP